MSKITASKPLLILLYGYPGAGKTYLARQLTDQLQAAHVQGERIRFELFDKPQYDKEENSAVSQLMDYMTHEFLSAGMSVVYDTNALRLAQRHALREMARKSRVTSVLIWMQIDPDSALARASKRDKRRSDDKFAASIDRATFDSIARGMQNPSSAEDYVVVSGKHNFATQFSAVVKRLHEMGLLSGHDLGDKLIKPGMVNLIPRNPMAGRVDLSRRNIIIR